ncbi:Proteasome assembly chaperone 3 [Gaertneriomyces sp. JEL0708]|nr:Proteasome assembly chaperone 3 [Gaertneriomyces sp. JEL0708]
MRGPAESDAASFPIKTRQARALLGDKGEGDSSTIQTDVVYTDFADRMFLTITQFGKIGSLLEATVDTPTTALYMSQNTVSSANTNAAPSISVRTLLGPRDEPLAHVYASHILSKIRAARPNETRPLLLGLALKRASVEEVDENDTQVLAGVMKLLEDDLHVW